MKRNDMNIKSSTRLLSVFIAVLLILILNAGCSSSRSRSGGKPTHNIPSATAPTNNDESEGEVVADFGDKKNLNLDLPPENIDASGDVNSIYYMAPIETTTNSNDFNIEGWEQPATSVIPAPEPTTISKPDTKPMNTPPIQSEGSEPPIQSDGDNLQAQLKEAMVQKNIAFERYTKLSTIGGEGDINQALKEYKQAYLRVKELESRIAGKK